MKRKLIYPLGLILVIQAFSQQTRISGEIVESEINKSLPFATISIKNTSIGVVANKEGKFVLHVRSTEDSISISMLGYETLNLKVRDIEEKNQRIFQLKIKPVLLDEVIILEKNQKLNGEEILRLAIKKQKGNFPDNDYSLSVFFRETSQINDEYFKLVEAAATIYGKRYPNTNKKIFIDQIRTANNLTLPVSVVTEEDYNPFRDLQGLIGKVSNKRACADCKYFVEEYITVENGLAVVIVSTNENPNYPRIFRYIIDLETYAVLKMEFETYVPFGDGFPTSYPNYNSSLVYLKRTFSYKEYKNAYYLNRYHQQLKYEYVAMSDSLEDYKTTHDFHVISNNIRVSVKSPSENTNQMHYKDQLSQIRKSYDAEFWKTYNVLKLTPLDEKIISDLNRATSLDNLFKKK